MARLLAGVTRPEGHLPTHPHIQGSSQVVQLHLSRGLLQMKGSAFRHVHGAFALPKNNSASFSLPFSTGVYTFTP